MKFRIRPVIHKGEHVYACEYSYYRILWTPVETHLVGWGEEETTYFSSKDECLKAVQRFLDKLSDDARHLNQPTVVI
jgi:hypothetical protein